MTSEQNAPEVESHQGSTMSPGQQDGEAQFTPQNVQHGMGQSKSSRRRRRKRKNKGGDAQQGAQLGGDQGAGQSIAAIQGSAAQTSQPQSFQAGGGQQQNAPSGGGKRWKKKFRDRDRQRSPENPGNVASGSSGGFSNNGGGYRDRDTHQPGNNSGGFKRKGGKQQQRGPRSFVGPMDHSYRAVNGNFAETPPSTIESGNGNYGRSNGHGGGRSYQSDSQPIDYSQGRPIPIPENAPTKIFFFIEDLFFIAKIQETARKLGVKVAFVKNEKDAIAALTGRRRRGPSRPHRLRPQQCERQAPDPDPQAQGQAQAQHLHHRLPVASAGRPEGQGRRSGLRHGHAARRLLAEPAQPPPPLRHGRGRRAQLQPVTRLAIYRTKIHKERPDRVSIGPFIFWRGDYAFLLGVLAKTGD